MWRWRRSRIGSDKEAVVEEEVELGEGEVKMRSEVLKMYLVGSKERQASIDSSRKYEKEKRRIFR